MPSEIIPVGGALLVERIEGCYFTLVGFALVRLERLLRRCGVPTADWLGPGPPMSSGERS